MISKTDNNRLTEHRSVKMPSSWCVYPKHNKKGKTAPLTDVLIESIKEAEYQLTQIYSKQHL